MSGVSDAETGQFIGNHAKQSAVYKGVLYFCPLDARKIQKYNISSVRVVFQAGQQVMGYLPTPNIERYIERLDASICDEWNWDFDTKLPRREFVRLARIYGISHASLEVD